MRTAISFTVVLAVIGGPGSAGSAETRPDMVIRWNRILLHAIRTDGTSPPMAARNMAIVHGAVYDAVNAIVGTHQHFHVQVAAAPGTSPEAAAAAAAYGTLVLLYPQQRMMLDREFANSLAELPAGDARERGVSLGMFVADRMLAWRQRDGASNSPAYRRIAGVGYWEPTPPAYKAPLLPGWGSVKPLVIQSAMRTPTGPPRLSSAAYAQAFEEVKALGGRVSQNRTPDQTQIAQFWADGEGTVTPPGHWNEIAQTVAMQRGNNLMQNAYLFAMLNCTMADAAIWCWHCKFTYNFWRPVTGIQQAGNDGNPNTAPDPTWTPLLTTPPFPAYTSGHSTFSGAASEVLAAFCGADQFSFQSSGAGMTRSFVSFSQAAEEAGQSRIYGGIHWQFDNTDGLAWGRALGRHGCRYYMLRR